MDSQDLYLPPEQAPLAFTDPVRVFGNRPIVDIALDTRVLPVYAVALSFLILVITGVQSARRVAVSNIHSPLSPWKTRLRTHAADLGGYSILAFKLAGATISVTFCACTVFTFQQQTGDFEAGIALCVTAFYAAVCATLAVVFPSYISRPLSRHAYFVSFATFVSYSYRDIWPLCTVVLRPMDRSEGPLLWVKVGLIATRALLLPVFEPYPYIPVDPSDAESKPSPEQTVPLALWATFAFMDPIVYHAYKVPHVKPEDYPPMCDYDKVKNLAKQTFPHLDPFSSGKVKRTKNLFLGFCWVFRTTLLNQSIIIFIDAVFRLAAPIGVNGLLHYLETNGEGAYVQAWVWILAIASGKFVNMFTDHTYGFYSARMLCWIEAVITTLVFDHSLRIRLKASTLDSTGSSSSVTREPSRAVTPVHEGEQSEAETLITHRSEAGASESTAAVDNEASGHKSKAKIQEEVKKGEDNLTGLINDLVTSDLANISEGRSFLICVLDAPIEIIGAVIFLIYILGWSAVIGLVVMICLFPVPAWIAKTMQNTQHSKMEATDARIKVITELIGIVRMIKLFGWQDLVDKRVDEKRAEELALIWKTKLLDVASSMVSNMVSKTHMIVTYLVYTLVFKQKMTAAIVFSSMTGFDLISQEMNVISRMLPALVRANVSLQRVQQFLNETELLDEFSPDAANAHEAALAVPAAHLNDIGMGRAHFAWSASAGTVTPSGFTFRLKIDNDVIFKRGSINLIIGPTGSGKTSLLMALLGELHYLPSGLDAWVNLPRDGGIAYAAQESWIQNETIRENILFGSAYNQERYEKVIYQCALKRDLELFGAGDMVEVGEKGITLSGGQKARITLARAIYSSARIILLDDILAALDVQTSQWIVEKCFKGDLVQGRTILLVTHNIAVTKSIAHHVITLNTDGRVVTQGSLTDALSKNAELSKEFEHDKVAIDAQKTNEVNQVDDSTRNIVASQADDGKLILKEEVAVGDVSKRAYGLFFGNMSGPWLKLYWTSMLLSMFLREISAMSQLLYLGYWAQQYTFHPSEDINPVIYLSVYVGLLVLMSILNITYELLLAAGTLRSSRVIHQKLMAAILHSTFRWLDTTPMSRILARCTQDIQAVDGSIAMRFSWTLDIVMSILVSLGGILIYSPVFVVVGVFIGIMGTIIGQVYVKAQLAFKRDMSNAKAPILAKFNGAINGLTSVRAYQAQGAFRQATMSSIDQYVQISRTYNTLGRWIGVRMDALASSFVTGLAIYLVYGKSSISATGIGFSLNVATGFSSYILWGVINFNEFRVASNSLERLESYIDLETEPKSTETGKPPAYWPASGDIRAEKLSARYSPTGPKVLHDLSFHIEAGSRVGVVGRTGSGKSSLTLALLRAIYTDGEIYYDGLPISRLNLTAVRSNITIIPQVPELISGTLRHNLDIVEEHDDAVLNDALRSAGLFALQSDMDEGQLTLDSQISGGGANLSVGQRQIVALARAIVRQSKLLILDEATSAIDYETDSIIQSSLRNELKKDVTLITVAHRLQTIMDYDKIMVLDAGRLVEFATPQELLGREGSYFRSLVDQSADRDVLYSLAKTNPA